MAINAVTNHLANMQLMPYGVGLAQKAGLVALALSTIWGLVRAQECQPEMSWDKLAVMVGTGSAGECEKALAQYPQASAIRDIASALGGNEMFCRLPVLSWQDRFHEGKTGYIDGVKPEDLASPIMRGVDPWSRPFLALHTEESLKSGEKTTGAEVLFQRYTSHPDPWTSGNHYQRAPLVSGTVDSDELDQLARLVDGETVKLSYSDTTKKLIHS